MRTQFKFLQIQSCYQPLTQLLRFVFPSTLLLPAALVLSLTACSSSSEPEPELNEIPSTEGFAVDTPEMELLHTGKRLYKAEMYIVARDAFESLKNGYPLSPYALFAEMKIADTYFELRDYGPAAALYEEFLDNHPGSQEAAYVMLRAAQSYELSHRGAGRDVTPLERALEMYNELITTYPDTIYAQMALQKRLLIFKKLAEHEELIRSYYERKGASEASAAREARAQEFLQTAASPPPAPKTPAPTKPFVFAAAMVHTKNESQSTPAVQQRDFTKNADIRFVSCRRKEPQRVSLHLAKAFRDASFLNEHSSQKSNNGLIEFEFPLTAARELVLDCFGEGDLELSKTGKLTLQTKKNATLIDLQTPPRLVILLQ